MTSVAALAVGVAGHGAEMFVAPLPPADDRIYGPYAFSMWWLVGGVAALVTAGVLAVWSLRRVRPPHVPRLSEPQPSLRARYLARLDELEQDLARRRVGTREVHHELSRTLRNFAADTGISGASAMSPAALEDAGASSVAAAVRSYEHPQFEEHPIDDPARALRIARAVIVGANLGDPP